jgi:macrolide-specific efflux system membrane fusion protein
MKAASLVLLGALLAGSGAWFLIRGNDRLGDAEGSASGRTAEASRRNLSATVLATGVVRPMVGAEVKVGSRISGVLQHLHVTVGDRVREGQLLARLDSTEFAARVAQAEAALANANAEHAYAAREHARAQRLHEQAIITDAEIAAREREREVTASQVRQAEANLALARIQLGYARIYAPIAGVVAEVATQVGETVAASFASPTFVTIIDLDRLEVWAYVDETDIGRVAVGQRASFTIDTYPDTEFEGEVTAIRPMAEIQDAVVDYITVIDIADGHGKTLRPEMTTTVNIELESREGVLAIPNAAVRRDPGGAYVFLVQGEDRARRDIRVGYRSREFTEVLAGLQDGDRVIVGTVP